MRWIRGAGRALAALLISALIWEAVLRVFIFRPIPYAHNPRLGWMPRPYANGLQTQEGWGVCDYNELGFRDSAIEPRQPAQARILVLGDSYVEGKQVMADRLFTLRLQGMLRQRLRVNSQSTPEFRRTFESVRVFNGGRDGVSPAYTVYLSNQYRKIFDPDWVVLLVHDSSWQQTLRDAEIRYRPAGKGFVLERRWHWDEMSPRLKRVMQSPLHDWSLPLYSMIRLNLLRRPLHDDASGNPQAAAPPAVQPVAQPAARDEPNYADAKRLDKNATAKNAARLELTRRVMAWTLRQLKRRYPRLVLLHMPMGSPDLDGPLPLAPEEMMLAQQCRREGIAMIALRDRIARDYAQTREPPSGFSNTAPWAGHPNAHGHELIARALDDFFAARLASKRTDKVRLNSGVLLPR